MNTQRARAGEEAVPRQQACDALESERSRAGRVVVMCLSAVLGAPRQSPSALGFRERLTAPRRIRRLVHSQLVLRWHLPTADFSVIALRTCLVILAPRGTVSTTIGVAGASWHSTAVCGAHKVYLNFVQCPSLFDHVVLPLRWQAFLRPSVVACHDKYSVLSGQKHSPR